MLTEIDLRIIDEINKKTDQNPDFWSFKEVTKKEGIHSIMRYPATMVPQMLEELVKIISSEASVSNILDPYMGSGTVLVEGIKNRIDVYGMDINPMSYLLCKVKTTYISIISLKRELSLLETDISRGLLLQQVHQFKNINKWFKEDIIVELSKLRSRINQINNKKVRKFMYICFADVVTDVKNSQSSTFKLHVKPDEKIEKFNYDVIPEFIKKVTIAIRNYEQFYEQLRKDNRRIKWKFDVNRKIICGNSIDLKQKLKLETGSIDLIVTSPPYGDNGTTVTYGQYSILPLYWIFDDDIGKEFDNNLLENFSAIDSSSLGGKLYTIKYIEKSEILSFSDTLREYYEALLRAKVEKKARKVASFIIDFYESMKQQIDVLKVDGYLVMVVGNRTVHDIVFPFDKIIEELLASRFELLISFNRNIHNKKMATRISKVGNTAVKSMTAETILILKKIM